MSTMDLTNYRHMVRGLSDELDEMAKQGGHPNFEAMRICREAIIANPLPVPQNDIDTSRCSVGVTWGQA